MNFGNIGNITDSFKNPGSGSVRLPSPDDFTTIFTDIKTAVMEFVDMMTSGAKKSTLGASFMENASHIIGLAVLILGIVLYIQIQIGNEEASKDVRNTNKYATSIIDDIDAEKPSSKISKRVTIELFTPPTPTSTPKLENPHKKPDQAKLEPMTADNVSVASIGTAVENTVIGAVSNLFPNGPSMETREKLQQKSATCKSTDGFCKLNHDKLDKVCSDITSQGTCAEKCCCGWVKFSNVDEGSDGVQPKPGSGVLNSLGISPDGKCVAGSIDGPELTFGRDIDYYYYMGECMKGVCKPKGSTA
jgi:hypothetical protein